VAATILAGLWTRPSSSTFNRNPDSNLIHLREALAAHKKRIQAAGLNQHGLKGLFVAPEYYFAQAEMGSWNAVAKDFRTRSIEQSAKEAIVLQLQKISKDFPGIIVVPGSIAWRKPLVRSGTDKFHRNKSTGIRTGVLKTSDRSTKAFQRISSVGDFNMGGGARYNDDFWDAMWKVVTSNSNTWWKAEFDKLKKTMSDSDALEEICKRAAGDDMTRNAVISKYNLASNSVHLIPGTAAKTLVKGTATHMMRNTAYLLYNGKIRFKYNKKGDFHESIGDDANTVYVPGDKLGLSDPIEGTTIGMEICLDHRLGTLNTGFPSGKKDPHIHVVVSDSVTNTPAKMKARKYFVHASTDSKETSVYRMQGGPTKENPEAYTDTVDGGTISYWKLSMVEASKMY
jgi:predicted amidohydrolase